MPGSLSAQGNPSLAHKLAADPLRPQFHLLPASGWMNDPNGPIYVNGKYHMFFQHNPFASVWGNMSWGHAVSADMIHWKHLPVALSPTPGTHDAFGVFSGSAIAQGNRVYALYTGTVECTPEKATIRDGLDHVRESQCLAFTDDPELVQWTKLPQPVIPGPPPGLNITGFRDPSVWKQDEWFYMTVGSGIARTGGSVLLYRSKDLTQWSYLHQLTSGPWNGTHTTNPCDDGEMWECPEFFPLDGGHVLIYSTMGKVIWQSGVLDVASMKFAPARTGLLDLDAFYAPKTQLDAHGRRILWGWIPERRSESAMKEAGWSGMMSLPRVMNLDQDGTLRLRILPQAASLRSGEILQDVSRSGILKTLRNASGEIMCSGTTNKSFEFTLNNGDTELLQVSYSADKHAFVAGGKEIALRPTDVPTLQAFVDGSVIEIILSERIGWTKRFYYPGTTAPDMRAWANGTDVKLTAWEIRPISKNRLATPV